MSQNDEQIKGKAIVIKADKNPPDAETVREMQRLARRAGVNVLGLLEAEVKQFGE